MNYQFLLGVVPLPVTPSALNIKTPSMNKTISLINEGEINIPKKKGLREISFDFLLPQVQKYPFANYQIGRYTATVMIPLLNAWKDTQLPFRFIVVRLSPSGKILYFTNIKCLIEDYEYDEDAEKHGLDVMCSITLKEYRDYGTKSVSLKDVKGKKVVTETKPRPTDDKETPKSVKTTKKDTIPNIAKKHTGSFNNADKLANANGINTPPTNTAVSTTPVEVVPATEAPMPTEVKWVDWSSAAQNGNSINESGRISIDGVYGTKSVEQQMRGFEELQQFMKTSKGSALDPVPSKVDLRNVPGCSREPGRIPGRLF